MLSGVAAAFTSAKKKYDKGGNALAETLRVGTDCLTLLKTSATLRPFGYFSGPPQIEYWVAEAESGLSRPYRPDLFIGDPATFSAEAKSFVQELNNGQSDPDRFDRVVYTTVSAFCLCYDVWKPKSRKTPGTFFEVLIASAARVRFPAMAMTKHVPIKDLPTDSAADALVDVDGEEGDAAEAFKGDSVSTDLVLTNPMSGQGAVVPLNDHNTRADRPTFRASTHPRFCLPWTVRQLSRVHQRSAAR